MKRHPMVPFLFQEIIYSKLEVIELKTSGLWGSLCPKLEVIRPKTSGLLQIIYSKLEVIELKTSGLLLH